MLQVEWNCGFNIYRVKGSLGEVSPVDAAFLSKGSGKSLKASI